MRIKIGAVLILKKNIANTIVRMAKADALFLGEKSSLRSSRKTNYNKEPLPPDRKESSTQ
jgi:hypothetical protein